MLDKGLKIVIVLLSVTTLCIVVLIFISGYQNTRLKDKLLQAQIDKEMDIRQISIVPTGTYFITDSSVILRCKVTTVKMSREANIPIKKELFNKIKP